MEEGRGGGVVGGARERTAASEKVRSKGEESERSVEEVGRAVKKARHEEELRRDWQKGGNVSTTNLSPSPPSPHVSFLEYPLPPPQGRCLLWMVPKYYF